MPQNRIRPLLPDQKIFPTGKDIFFSFWKLRNSEIKSGSEERQSFSFFHQILQLLLSLWHFLQLWHSPRFQDEINFEWNFFSRLQRNDYIFSTFFSDYKDLFPTTHFCSKHSLHPFTEIDLTTNSFLLECTMLEHLSLFWSN